MVCEPVEQRAGEPFRAEDRGPFIERQVGGDERGTTFIALAEHLEEQFGTDRGEGHVSLDPLRGSSIDNQQFDRVEVFLQSPQPAFVARFHEFMHESGGRGEGDAVVFLAGGEPNARAMWVLPVPEGPNAMQLWRFSIHSQRASSRTSGLLSDGWAAKSKVSRLLVWGNRAARMRRSMLRRSRSMRSSSHRRSR